jgi:heterotetrameric sarcosine oxidase gamma subunit
VTGLAFLTPDAVSESVSARTPMDRRARAAGARFDRRQGWSVAVAYGEPAVELERLSQTVAFADRSSLMKLELQAEAEVLAAVVGAASSGLALRPGVAARAAGAWWCPVTTSRVLVLGEPAAASALRESVSGAVRELGGGGTVTVADVTCGLAALALIGPGANELLARFCAIDVRPVATPVAGFRPGSVARTPGYLLREDEDRLLVLVGWALGEYLWEVVADAAEHLGGGPVGADALKELDHA